MTCENLTSIQRGFDLLGFMGLSLTLGICLAKLRSMRRRIWAIGEQTLVNQRDIKDLKAVVGDQYASRH